tara:strand:+ start:167 stop:1723 length:1557 start_codon:yes stop_codon:yes gene_type:complete
MILLIETPGSLLDSYDKAHGANKVSYKLYCLFLAQKDHFIIILTDLSTQACNHRNQALKADANHFFINYESLPDYLISETIIPDAALSFDIKIKRLLLFRNCYKYDFPVIGLIHSLGFITHFDDLICLKPLLTECDKLICPSDNTQQTAIKAGIDQSNLVVAHYGVDHRQFIPVSALQKKALRKRLSLPIHHTILLYVSRLSPYLKSDLTPMIRLLPELVSHHSNFTLYIVGTVLDLDYVNQLKQLVTELNMQDHIIWNHDPNHDDMPLYYQSSDFYLGLSDYAAETYGLTITEAMATGLPVILSEHAGYKHHITHDIEGFYIPTLSGNIDLDPSFYTLDSSAFGYLYSQSIALDNALLIQYISQLIDSSKKRHCMGKNARYHIEQDHTLDHMYQRFLAVVQDAVTSFNSKKPELPNPYLNHIQQLLSHQSTRCLCLEDRFCLTHTTIAIITTKSNCFFFESQYKTYKLINVIIHLLSVQSYSLAELCTHLTESQEEIEKNCLFLLKQHIISLSLDHV